jgi:quinolinate synthase
LKAFVGEHEGTVCTSTNAPTAVKWALEQGTKMFFFPDQHLGRTTGVKLGYSPDEMVLWDPFKPMGGNTPEAVQRAKFILWKGHCSVHQMFQASHVHQFREKYPGIKILVHPECPQEVNDIADISGSTSKIIETVKKAPPGSQWAIGTELHLVNRLKEQHPEQQIHFLSPLVCMCATMYRIDLAHLCWSLENIVQGTVVNQIHVKEDVANWSLIALERMLAVK